MHADKVIPLLVEMGHEPIRLNTEDIPMDALMNFRLAASGWQGTIKLTTNNREIDLGDIRSVWCRRPNRYSLPADFSAPEQNFAKAELDHLLQGLWETLDCYWISALPNIRRANWKPGQLKRAKEMGFEVPETLITNDPTEVRAFYENCHGQIVYKIMSDPSLVNQIERNAVQHIQKQSGTLTTLLTNRELEMLETV